MSVHARSYLLPDHKVMGREKWLLSLQPRGMQSVWMGWVVLVGVGGVLLGAEHALQPYVDATS